MNEAEMQEYLNDAKSEIGFAIVKNREAKKLSQVELSEKTDISLKTLSRIENGNSNYTIDNLLRILEENELELIIADKTKKKEVVSEYTYDLLITFLIALPFVPYYPLYDSLSRIGGDFDETNMHYVCRQFERLIALACRDEKNRKTIKSIKEAYDLGDEMNEKDFGEAYSSLSNHLESKMMFSLEYKLDELWAKFNEKHINTLLSILLPKKKEAEI